MAGQYELLFFGMFVVVIYKYALPPIVEYVKSYATLKKQEYLHLLKEEEVANMQLQKVTQNYTAKLMELEAVGDKLDNISQEVLSDFRKKNQTTLEIYQKSEKRKIKDEITQEEEKLVDSCMEMLETQIYQELKAQNVTCFDIALKKIREIVEKEEK